MDHTHDVLHLLLDFIYAHWLGTLATVSAVAGFVGWALMRTFPTHEKMEKCRKEIAGDVEGMFALHEKTEGEQHRAYAVDNQRQHDQINTTIGRVHQAVHSVQDEIGELKNIIIQLHGKDK